MPARLLVIEHEPGAPVAHLGTWLVEAGAALEVCRPWAGDEVPGLAGYAGFVILGGSMGANDDHTHPWLAAVKERIREAAETGLPTLGLCLGHQLVAVALGGTVQVNPRGQQVGLYDVGWRPEAADDPHFSRFPSQIRGIQWNSDIVTALSEGAVTLAATADDELQVVRFAPRVWGVQLHPEADEPVVRSWAAGDRDDHLERGIDQAAVLAEIDAARAELDEAWRPLATGLVALAEAPR
ncbi:MAG: type 1 glutamine amidotransferase [Nocardioides sp.]